MYFKKLFVVVIFIAFLASCTIKTPEPVNWKTVEPAWEPAPVSKDLQREEEFKSYLEKYDSPLASYTDLIFEACKEQEHDCDPCLIIAIGMAETTLGKNMGGNYNFWNYLKDGVPHNYESWENAIWALAYEFGDEGSHANKSSLEEINGKDPKFCTSGCEHWMANVTAVYNDLSSAGCSVDTDLTFPDSP